MENTRGGEGGGGRNIFQVIPGKTLNKLAIGSNDLYKIFENCYTSSSFRLAQDIRYRTVLEKVFFIYFVALCR